MPTAGLSTRRVVQLTALLALTVFYAAQLAGALLPNVPLFITASVAGLALDIYLTHQQPGLLALLGKVRFDVTTRQLLRDMLIVIGLVRIPDVPPDIERPLTLLLLAAYATHFLCQAVAQLVRRSRTLPILTRNIDASPLRLTISPPRLLARQPSRRLLRFSIPGTVGLVLSAGLASELWGILGVGLSIALSLGGAVYLSTWMLPKKRARERAAGPGVARQLAGEVQADGRHVLLRRHHFRVPGEHVALHARPARRQPGHRAP